MAVSTTFAPSSSARAAPRHGARVALVGGLIVLAQVGPDADRRQPQAFALPEVALRGPPGKALPVARGPFRGRKTRDLHPASSGELTPGRSSDANTSQAGSRRDNASRKWRFPPRPLVLSYAQSGGDSKPEPGRCRNCATSSNTA